MAQIEGTLILPGTLVVQGSAFLPNETVSDAMVQSAAGIDASKLDHQHRANYEQESATTAASEARVVHVAKGAGTVIEFKCGCVVANIGAATVTFDLLKNGVTILTAAVVVDSGDAAYAKVAGTISSGAYVAGDVFEVSVVAAAGGGTLGKGAFAYADLDEAYQ